MYQIWRNGELVLNRSFEEDAIYAANKIARLYGGIVVVLSPAYRLHSGDLGRELVYSV